MSLDWSPETGDSPASGTEIAAYVRPIFSGSDPNVLTITGSIALAGPITGSVSLTGPITGSVGLTEPITGSVSLSRPITGSVALTEPITGSVGLTGPITGSVGLTGPITGSVGLTGPITGSVSITGPITGSVGLTEPITGSVSLSRPITGSVGLTGPITGSVSITGPINVVITPSPQSLPLLVNLNYEQTDGAILNNSYKRVVSYTVPPQFNGWLIRYSSFQNESAKSRFSAPIEMGTLNTGTNAYVAGSTFNDPQWSSVIEAEVTTVIGSAANIVITVTYTSHDGVASRSGTISIPKNSTVGSRFVIILQAGDIGIRSIQNLSSSPNTSGAIKIIGHIQLAYHNDLSATNQLETNYQPGAIAFPSGTVLAIEYAGGTVAKSRLFDVLIQLVTGSS